MAETMAKAWEGFVGGAWEKTIDVRDFIQKNYTPYEGDESFLAGPTDSTKKLWSEVMTCSRRNVKTAAFWTWTPSWFLQ